MKKVFYLNEYYIFIYDDLIHITKNKNHKKSENLSKDDFCIYKGECTFPYNYDSVMKEISRLERKEKIKTLKNLF